MQIEQIQRTNILYSRVQKVSYNKYMFILMHPVGSMIVWRYPFTQTGFGRWLCILKILNSKYKCIKMPKSWLLQYTS